jgi:perosamine synthetase
MKSRLAYTRPSITDLEVAYASDAARSGWGEACYDYIIRFERAFAQHIGARFVIATSSCTGALHMGLYALGVGHGDEVILADTNWIATVSPIVHLGAQPVFVDILPDTWCIDPACVENAITPRTKAIIATHIYGNLCDMDMLLAIGVRHGIPVIEDAAEAIGSVYDGRRAGSMGAFGVFSFHGTKTLTTGEGGAFVTSNEALYQRVLTLSNHGRAHGETRQFWPAEVGFKFRISNLQAAVGCAQLERVEELVARKREILQAYKSGVEHLTGVSINTESPGCINGAWMPTLVFSPETGVTRENLLTSFAHENIDARVFFHPVSSFDMFEACPSNRWAYDIPNRAVNLPSFHDMTRSDIARVLSVVTSVYNVALK